MEMPACKTADFYFPEKWNILLPLFGQANKNLMTAPGVVPLARGPLEITAIGLQFPGASSIIELSVEHRSNSFPQFLRLNRHKDLDPVFQITLHGIGRSDKILFFTTITEIVDHGMLQEAADYADNPHIF